MLKSIVFPGQGSQKVGMGKEFYDSFVVAKDVFLNIDDSLSQNLSRIIFNGPLEELTLTENTQPAIMAVSIAILEVLKKDFGFDLDNISFCAGHSLGEYTALAATNTLSVREVAKLLKNRGLSMQQALPEGKGAMAALIGIEIDKVKKLLELLPNNLICNIANYNSINQIVVSGDTEAIDKLLVIAKEKKLKAIKLLVSAPFHCEYMKDTAKKLQNSFHSLDFNKPTIPIITNYTAKPFIDVEDLKKSLISQTFSTVKWYESMNYMFNKNVNSFFEIGNGSTLSNIIKRMNAPHHFTANSLSSIKSIELFMRENNES